jgi:F-type H+-transporting ATPase subunit a
MFKDDASALSSYDPFSLQPQIVTIGVVMLIILVIYITYYTRLKKIPINKSPCGFVLMIQIYVAYVRSLVVDVMGKKMEKLTPFFIFLFSYLIISNTIGIVGLENPTASLTVTLSFGLIMFIGTFVIGFRYQKLTYLTRFTFNYTSKKSGRTYPLMINPLSFTDVIAPLISISFRL